MQFGFVQCAVVVPELRGAAFGDELEAVEPGALADGTEVIEGLLIEVHQRAGFVGKAGEVHGSQSVS